MNLLFMGGLVLIVILIVLNYRKNRDRGELAARVEEMGGTATSIQRVKRGHPFPSIGRGWWAWRIQWRDRGGERTSWALTTREGIKDWQDGE